MGGHGNKVSLLLIQAALMFIAIPVTASTDGAKFIIVLLAAPQGLFGSSTARRV